MTEAKNTVDKEIDREIEDILLPEKLKEIRKSSVNDWQNADSIKDIKDGDHVTYWKFPYWKHGVVVNKDDNAITILRYKFCPNGRLFSLACIDEEVISFERGWRVGRSPINLKRAKYSGQCYPQYEIVRRARLRQGEMRYHYFRNFARGFPPWCRTGYGGITYAKDINLSSQSEVVKISDLKPGDHIKFDRGPFFHHAIVDSTDKKFINVYHYTGNNLNVWMLEGKGAIYSQKIEPYFGTLYKVKYRSPIVQLDTAVLRAKKMKSHDDKPKYNLLSKNCEHYSTWCETGIWQGAQVGSFHWQSLTRLRLLTMFHALETTNFVYHTILTSLSAIPYAPKVGVTKLTKIMFGKTIDLTGSIIFASLDLFGVLRDTVYQYRRGESQGYALWKRFLSQIIRFLAVSGCTLLFSIYGQCHGLQAFWGGFCGTVFGELIASPVLRFLSQWMVSF